MCVSFRSCNMSLFVARICFPHRHSGNLVKPGADKCSIRRMTLQRTILTLVQFRGGLRLACSFPPAGGRSKRSFAGTRTRQHFTCCRTLALPCQRMCGRGRCAVFAAGVTTGIDGALRLTGELRGDEAAKASQLEMV